MRIKRSAKVAVAAAAAVVLAGGVAFAYWSSGGGGTGGAATSAGAEDITIHQTGPAITGLVPGGSPVALAGDFTNLNAAPVPILGVTARVSKISTTPDKCGFDDFLITGTPAPTTVPSGTHVGAWSGLSVQFANKPTVNQDGCKNVTITVAYSLVAPPAHSASITGSNAGHQRDQVVYPANIVMDPLTGRFVGTGNLRTQRIVAGERCKVVAVPAYQLPGKFSKVLITFFAS